MAKRRILRNTLDSDGYWADFSSSEKVDVTRWHRRSVSRWVFGVIGVIVVLVVAGFSALSYYTWDAAPHTSSVVDKVAASTFTTYCGNAQGTGVAVNIPKPDGVKTIVISAAHVFDDCEEGSTVQVEYEGRKYSGKLYAKDPQHSDLGSPENRVDLARIDLAAAFPALDPAPAAETGDWAIIVGNPLGRSNYATLGIVAGVHEKYYETDAAANEGNSGGPMVDNHARILGIVSSGQLKQTAEGDLQDANGMVQVMRLNNACGRLFPSGLGCPFRN